MSDVETPTLVQPVSALQVPAEPADFPGLVCFWDFAERGEDGAFPATAGAAYLLREQAGRMPVVEDPAAPFNHLALHVAEGCWLAVDRKDCPRLDIHGRDGFLTVVAWVRRHRTQRPHCEFIAGQWNESRETRQYGLFLNIGVWGQPDQVCGHLSTVGGPTPGYQFCMDGPVGATKIHHDVWRCVAMSYDGQHGYVWVDGQLDARAGLNPYLIPGGLHDGGPQGSDFTVGAVDRSGVIGNFYTGLLGGLAVYDRVLTPAEMWALCRRPAPTSYSR
jgi:hypothetical protein